MTCRRAGKSFTFITTTFAYADVQTKNTSFVASINWGDGSAPVAGSVTADGPGQFQVTGSHTYTESGTYPIVTTISDIASHDRELDLCRNSGHDLQPAHRAA